MVRVQIVSDLHIEYNNSEYVDPLSFIKPSADILILAGDIGSLYKQEQLKDFLEKICAHFKHVFYIPGNWEYYLINGYTPVTMNNLMYRLSTIAKTIRNLHVLDHSSILIEDNVCIAGCTLWSHLEIDLPKYIVRIHKVNTESYNLMYEKSVKYIKKIIDYCQNKKYKLILVTHHCPTYKTLAKSTKPEKLFSLYSSHLDCLLYKDLVNTWICGHTHSNFDFITEEGTRVVSNQKGKPKDSILDYKKDFVIDIC
jgi:Icc-related predicted phosphoesterase